MKPMTEKEIREKLGLTSAEEAELHGMELTARWKERGLSLTEAIKLRHRASGRTTNTVVSALSNLSQMGQVGRVFIIAGHQSHAREIQRKVHQFVDRLGENWNIERRLIVMGREAAERELDRGYTEGGENPPIYHDHTYYEV